MKKIIRGMVYVAFAAIAQQASAQGDFPSQPIRFIVPYAPASAPDLQARFIGKKVAEMLKQPVVVDNRPGAGGLIGGEAVAKAAPDGYTIGYFSTQHLVHKYLIKSVPYDVLSDLQPIQMISTGPQVVVVSSANPAKTLGEFVQRAKEAGQPATFGSGGIGSPAHLAGQALAMSGGFKVTHVPYKSSPESLNGLMGGQIDYIVTTSQTAIPLVNSGKVKALAITSPQRSDLMPGVPTLVEAMPNGFTFESWGMLMTPARTPKPVVEKLRTAFEHALKDKETVEFFAKSGFRIETMAPEKLSPFLKEEQKKMESWIRAAELQPQ